MVRSHPSTAWFRSGRCAELHREVGHFRNSGTSGKRRLPFPLAVGRPPLHCGKRRAERGTFATAHARREVRAAMEGHFVFLTGSRGFCFDGPGFASACLADAPVPTPLPNSALPLLAENDLFPLGVILFPWCLRPCGLFGKMDTQQNAGAGVIEQNLDQVAGVTKITDERLQRGSEMLAAFPRPRAYGPTRAMTPTGFETPWPHAR